MSKTFQDPRDMVASIITKFKTAGTTANLPARGRTSNVYLRGIRHLKTTEKKTLYYCQRLAGGTDEGRNLSVSTDYKKNTKQGRTSCPETLPYSILDQKSRLQCVRKKLSKSKILTLGLNNFAYGPILFIFMFSKIPQICIVKL